MNAPFDPAESQEGPENEDPFGENSMTWGAADPDFDRMLRDRLGPMPTMPTPPYAFERVLLAGRRRRARKVWAAGAAAAIVVMAGTASTTVALRHTPSGGLVGPASTGTQQAPKVLGSPSAGVTASPTPTASGSSAPASASSTPAPTASPSDTTTVSQCHSDDLQLTVSVAPASTSGSAGTLLIVLHNNSSHACTTYGYPGLQTETTNEQLQSTTVTRINLSQVKQLTVGPGQDFSTIATFTTVASNVTPSPGAGCGAPSAFLAVIPPNEKIQIAATIQGGPVTVCGNGVLDTSPLVMGKTGGQ